MNGDTFVASFVVSIVADLRHFFPLIYDEVRDKVYDEVCSANLNRKGKPWIFSGNRGATAKSPVTSSRTLSQTLSTTIHWISSSLTQKHALETRS